MPFMGPEIVFGRWVQVEGNVGTEFVDADLIGEIEPYQGQAIPIPEELEPYCENRTTTEIRMIHGYGARFSAPGYMDCTPWSVFETEQEAHEYLDEQVEDD